MNNPKQRALEKKKGIKFDGTDIHGDRHRRAKMRAEFKGIREAVANKNKNN